MAKMGKMVKSEMIDCRIAIPPLLLLQSLNFFPVKAENVKSSHSQKNV